MVVAGCLPRLEVTTAEIEAQIREELPARSGRLEIEAFLDETLWPYSFDEHARRYQGVIRHPESNFHAITVYLYVDLEDRLLRFEAHDSYTFL